MSKTMLDITGAFEKFIRYTNSVEEDLETLILSMLELVDSKTKTLKKLIKLHLHIQRAKMIANIKLSNDRLSESVSRTVTEDSVSLSQISFRIQEDSSERIQIEVNTGKNDKEAVCVKEDKKKCAIVEKINTTKKPENFCCYGTESSQTEDAVKGTYTVKNDVTVLRDCSMASKGDTIVNAKPIIDTATKEKEKKPHLNSITQELPPEAPSKDCGNQNLKSISTFSNYCIMSSLEGAINNLRDCQISDCGVYLDLCTYRNIVDMLSTVLSSYASVLSQPEQESLKVVAMGKSCTQPSLKATSEIPKRMANSATECNKCCRKNRMRN